MYFEKPKLNYELPEIKTVLISEYHIHFNVEMIYVDKGRFKALVDGTEYFVNEGDIFFAFPNQSHCYEKIEDFECTITKFSPSICGGLGDVINASVPKTNVIHTDNDSVLVFYLKKLENS